MRSVVAWEAALTPPTFDSVTAESVGHLLRSATATSCSAARRLAYAPCASGWLCMAAAIKVLRSAGKSGTGAAGALVA